MSHNPFADWGSIVCGERFIGRSRDLSVIDSRVVRPSEPGNLAVIGEPRVGKSSLVWKAVMDRRDYLYAQRRIPIWLNVATFDEAEIFFRNLVSETRDAVDDLGWMTESLDNAATRTVGDGQSAGYGRTQRFFQRVREANIRVIFLLDEFDAARHLFKDDLSGFQNLRELGYRPEFRVAFITTSRRSISTIETQVGSVSNLDGIFHKHYLGMFSAEDVMQLQARIEDNAVSISERLQRDIQRFCGRHPFLLERLAFALVEQGRDIPQVDFPTLERDLSSGFVDHYEKTAALLRDEGSLSKLLQILFGPVVDATQKDVERLLRYGLLQTAAEDDRYRAFSDHFEQFLEVESREVDLWPLWAKTERELRTVITEYVVEKFGDRWPDKLQQAHQGLKPMLEICRQNQAKELKTFGSRASTSLLDFTYPLDLHKIMRTEWAWFKPIFGGQANDWQGAFETLSRVRTPLAHNRDATVYESDRLKAQGFCRDILDRIHRWRAASNDA